MMVGCRQVAVVLFCCMVVLHTAGCWWSVFVVVGPDLSVPRQS